MNRRYWHRALSCSLLASLLWLSPSLAAERVTVEQLHKYHTSYHLHSVVLVGHVRNMHVLPPVPMVGSRRTPCKLLYDKSQFELVDETGTVPVETLGSCSPAAVNLPQNGDVIELTAQIHAFAPEGKTEPRIYAVAQHFVILEQTR